MLNSLLKHLPVYDLKAFQTIFHNTVNMILEKCKICDNNPLFVNVFP